MIEQPPVGLTTKCRVIRCTDGDTIVLELTKQIVVRLLDVWANEIKEGGANVKEYLEKRLPSGSECVVHIPYHLELDDYFTFGRILGIIYKDGININKELVDKELATKTKPKKKSKK